MSNRFLGLVIILFFTLIIGGLYYFFFIGNIYKITIKSNVENYSVLVLNNGTKISNSIECLEKECLISDLGPFEYTLIFSKEGFADYEKLVESRKEDLEINIKLEKQILFKKIEEGDLNEQSEKSVNPKDKIDELIKLKNTYNIFDLVGVGEFRFLEAEDGLILEFNGEEVSNFQKVPKEKTLVTHIFSGDENIDNVDNYVFIEVGEKKYIYDVRFSNFIDLDLNIEIKYIKKIDRSNDFLVVTDKGTFIYYYSSKKLEYFARFKDFVLYQDNYIVVVNNDDDISRSNLNIDSDLNQVILFDPVSKSTKLIYESIVYLDKLYFKDKVLIFQNKEGDKFKLENF